MKTQNQKLPVASSLAALKMKTSTLPRRFICHSRGMVIGLCSAVLLFAFARNGQAQFSTFAGTNIYNFFITNVTATTSYGTIDPDPNGPYGGDPLPSFTYQIGNPQLISGFVLANEPIGSASFNLVNNPTGGGTVLNLNNPTSVPYEVRLDWMCTYQNTSGSVASMPTTTIIAYGSWSPGSYWELAGAIKVYYNGGPYTATIGTTPSLYGPAGNGPWVGGTYSSSSTFTYTVPPLNWLPSNPSIQNGDTFLEQGYLDLIVDPGNVQIQIQSGQPPALGIGTYSNQPAVYFPSSPGTNFLVQMSTNLLTGPWVNVTNGIPLSGVIVPNAPSPAFFRLY